MIRGKILYLSHKGVAVLTVGYLLWEPVYTSDGIQGKVKGELMPSIVVY
jgi:hypothetical protein